MWSPWRTSPSPTVRRAAPVDGPLSLPLALLLLAARVAHDPLHLLDLLVADALAAAVAALQAVQDVLPHRQRRLQAARPVAAPLQLPAEVPLLREPLHAQEAPLPGLR